MAFVRNTAKWGMAIRFCIYGLAFPALAQLLIVDRRSPRIPFKTTCR